jgi:hypothetical protein
MFARTAPPPAAAPGADVTARAVGALALAALAVIHVVDLPATLGPTPLVGLGYLGIVAAAVLIGGVLITRSHWLAWAAGGAVAVSAMGGYVLTRAVPGGFLGDHGDVGNWRCPLGIFGPQRRDPHHLARGRLGRLAAARPGRHQPDCRAPARRAAGARVQPAPLITPGPVRSPVP